MSEPLFEVDESGEDLTRAAEASSGTAALSPAVPSSRAIDASASARTWSSSSTVSGASWWAPR